MPFHLVTFAAVALFAIVRSPKPAGRVYRAGPQTIVTLAVLLLPVNSSLSAFVSVCETSTRYQPGAFVLLISAALVSVRAVNAPSSFDR